MKIYSVLIKIVPFCLILFVTNFVYAGTPEGKTYETRAIDSLGQSMANFMQDCTSYFAENELSDFELIFRIKTNGHISEAFARPTNALSTCSKGIILNKKFPPHQFESFILHINMKTKK